MPRDLRKKGRRLVVAIGVPLAAVVAYVITGVVWSRRAPDPIALQRAYERGDQPVATKLARDLLKLRHDDPTALRVLARSAARQGRDDGALAIYTQRLDGNELEAEDYVILGAIYERKGQAEAADRALNKVLVAGALTPQTLDELARVQLRRRRWKEAAPIAERLSQQPGWEARGSMMLGTIRSSLNNFRGASESFRHALDVDPAEIDRSEEPTKLRKLIAITFLRMGRPVEARTVLQPILAHGKDQAAAWLMSRAYLQEGDAAQARSALADAESYRADHPLETEPAPYVGEARCETCHPAIFRESLASRHTQSFYRGEQLKELPRPDHPLPDPDDPAVVHSFRQRDGALLQETHVGQEVLRAVVAYAFGTTDRYLTMVSRDANGGYHVVRLSYYNTPRGRGWDRSALDKTHPSHDSALAARFQGESIDTREGVVRCLFCHVTDPFTGEGPSSPERADRAIGCERCHGPGGNHIAAVEVRFPDPAIVSPSGASPQAVTTKQCNECHILNHNFREGNLNDPGWLRSQGVGWSLSRCNTESAGAFGCVTCHDPHQSARATTTAQYELKCLSCHGPTVQLPGAGQPALPTPAQVVKDTPARPCLVNASKGCVSCHMPRIPIESLHLDITDHYIRVRRQ
jgi:predicted CXXCH cytochrome family protein